MRRAVAYVRQLSWIVFGAFVLAFAYYHINAQNHLSEGGFVGLALLAKYAFDLSPAITTLALDIPLFLVAFHVKGRQFLANTIIASIAFSVFYDLFERFSPLHVDLSGLMPLAALLSGLLTGWGAGIVLRYGGATGGDDILAVLLSRQIGLSIGTVFLLLDALVLSLSLWYLPLRETLYTILAVTIASRVVNWTAAASGRADDGDESETKSISRSLTLPDH
jgi:uncharacterized membrane-anchored protein YitT (DUF2179 family)